MRRLGAVSVALALGLAATLAAVSPATAAPITAPGAAPTGAAAGGTNLFVEISPPRGGGPETRTVPLTAWQRCSPTASNTHPVPAQACAEVIGAKGDIGAIAPLPGSACMSYVQPVTISVTGEVEGVPVDFKDVESNTGCASISHGHVFRIG